MFIIDPKEWSKNQFGHADLKDPRRTNRLVSFAASIAKQPGIAVSKMSFSPADMEAAYRFIRNDSIKASDIAEAGFQSTAHQAKNFDTLLAIEDTTTLSYRHESIKDELGHSSPSSKARALHAHSILLFSPNCQQVIGLIEQNRWSRDISKSGQSNQHAKRPYKEKESFKWEQASINMSFRLGEHINKVISVCDREADIFEYLTYKMAQKHRFIVRSMQSRRILEHDKKLFDYSNKLLISGQKDIFIPQRGGRKARTVKLDIKYTPVTLKAPTNKPTEINDISLYYVSAIEKGDKKDKLAWHLLTSESITCLEDALVIINYYERRWLVEDYHKVWKSGGTEVEEIRMQSADNIERMSVILAFVACRLLQLRFIKEYDSSLKPQSCERVLGSKAWKLLWLKTEKSPLPKQAPDMLWAYNNLAKLGGWKDTKRTGRASVKVLWEGWCKLQTILEGYELAVSLNHHDL